MDSDQPMLLVKLYRANRLVDAHVMPADCDTVAFEALSVDRISVEVIR